MSKKQKQAKDSAFPKLNKNRRKAVIMLFEGEKTQKEIAEEIGINNATLSKWKNDSLFKKAQREYSISQLDSALPLAIQKLIELINNGKSEMVKLQAIQTVLKRAGLLSDNSTPELDKARIRKANADARVAEAKAIIAERLGTEDNEQLDAVLEKLTKEAGKVVTDRSPNEKAD
ncbi:phBC6A51 family helix-turn-helix protein [Lactobacillus paragasseri]|uniref:phBC6A51 family helix-turn-helix protein n=1 Tax=Lactobacillus paragasseri TaxID=2107999 RepID=UPI00217D7B5F|nr:phBC6A51 family helix-turn-helix protein [Lactobacillus paragasseri]